MENEFATSELLTRSASFKAAWHLMGCEVPLDKAPMVGCVAAPDGVYSWEFQRKGMQACTLNIDDVLEVDLRYVITRGWRINRLMFSDTVKGKHLDRAAAALREGFAPFAMPRYRGHSADLTLNEVKEWKERMQEMMTLG